MTTNVRSAADLPYASRWCRSRHKRYIDIFAAASSLVCLSPLLVVLGLAIVITSGQPIVFCQWRVGRSGQLFQLYKFRTMTVSAAADGPGLTRRGDPRVTWIGKLLRHSKLDELPQLFNVLKGDMTLVGPRPDLKEFWSAATATEREVLTLKPGITGAASLSFRGEEQLLAQVPPDRLTSFYLQHVLPEKCRLDMQYAAQATLWRDCRLLWRTLLVPMLQLRNVERVSDAQVPGR